RTLEITAGAVVQLAPFFTPKPTWPTGADSSHGHPAPAPWKLGEFRGGASAAAGAPRSASPGRISTPPTPWGVLRAHLLRAPFRRHAVTQVLDLAKRYQQGRVPGDVTHDTFPIGRLSASRVSRNPPPAASSENTSACSTSAMVMGVHLPQPSAPQPAAPGPAPGPGRGSGPPPSSAHPLSPAGPAATSQRKPPRYPHPAGRTHQPAEREKRSIPARTPAPAAPRPGPGRRPGLQTAGNG